MLEKLIKSALGNAEDLRAPNVGGLGVKDARVDGGPMFKRMRPRARGMAHVVARRSAHISDHGGMIIWVKRSIQLVFARAS